LMAYLWLSDGPWDVLCCGLKAGASGHSLRLMSTRRCR
jgi:hypothetical protein